MIFDALDGKKPDRAPLWFMRQAGRYMAEYRAVREKYSFLQVCKTPELAALVTLQPVRKFDLDAAILFSDILLPVEAMGLGLDYSPGPVIVPRVSDMDAVERLRVPSADEFGFVRKAASAVLGELPKGKDLIGFAGAPFTVAAYMMQGGSRDGFPAVRRAAGTEMFFSLMDKVTRTTVQFMNAQAEAGVRVFQFFDTWAGLLEPELYTGTVLPFAKRAVEAAKGRGLKVIYFFRGGEGTARALSALGGVDAFSVDHSLPLSAFHAFTGGRKVMQGNLDPAVLTGDRKAIASGVDAVFRSAEGLNGHIFNLGHGVLPSTPEDNVAFAADYIRKTGAK